MLMLPFVFILSDELLSSNIYLRSPQERFEWENERNMHRKWKTIVRPTAFD